MENTFGTGRSLNVSERTTFRAGWANVLLHACMLIQFVIEGTVMNIATCPSMELNSWKKKFVSFPKVEATMAFTVLESPLVMIWYRTATHMALFTLIRAWNNETSFQNY